MGSMHDSWSLRSNCLPIHGSFLRVVMKLERGGYVLVRVSLANLLVYLVSV